MIFFIFFWKIFIHFFQQINLFFFNHNRLVLASMIEFWEEQRQRERLEMGGVEEREQQEQDELETFMDVYFGEKIPSEIFPKALFNEKENLQKKISIFQAPCTICCPVPPTCSSSTFPPNCRHRSSIEELSNRRGAITSKSAKMGEKVIFN